jgi:hypothetical protein
VRGRTSATDSPGRERSTFASPFSVAAQDFTGSREIHVLYRTAVRF